MDAYIAAVVSCAAMGPVYLVDRVMVGDVYSRPSQPMFVSSIFSFLPAPVFLLFGWSMPTWDAALLALLAGVVLMFASWSYFKVIFGPAGEATEVAAFESSSVIAIALMIALLSMFGFRMHEQISPHQWAGVLIAPVGLIALHLWGEKIDLVDWKHRAFLVFFMLAGGAYEMLMDRALYVAAVEAELHHTANPERSAFLSVCPFFWLGLSSGVVAMLPRGERLELRQQWKTILANWQPIVLAELLAIVAFGAMVYGFSGGHVAVIALIAGSFPLIVFFGGILLRRRFGYSEEKFPVVRNVLRKVVVVTIIILGIALASWSV